MEMAALTRGRRADSVLQMRVAPANRNIWCDGRLGGGTPPPIFLQTKRTIPRRALTRGGDPTRFPEVRMGTLRFGPQGADRLAMSVNGAAVRHRRRAGWSFA